MILSSMPEPIWPRGYKTVLSTNFSSSNSYSVLENFWTLMNWKILFLVLHIKITNTRSKIDKINYRHTINNWFKKYWHAIKNWWKKIHILQTISIKFRSFYFLVSNQAIVWNCYSILWCLCCFYYRIQRWLLSSS